MTAPHTAAAGRRLPHFIIIGAMKCGTTTLYRQLAAHPGIDMSRDKETDFFVAEKNWPQGLDWYEAQFARETPGAPRLRGEASPNYTKCRDFPGVAARMAETCPEARLVYIVRDPVARAESQFRHGVLMGTLPGGLEAFADSHEYHHILDASRYARQLAEYRRHFPAEAVAVLDFDLLVRDPQAVFDRVCDHIGAPRHAVADAGAQNDSRELSRVPAPVLRFAQSPAGRRIAGLVGRGTRDRIRRGLARGPARHAAPFPEALRARFRADLAADAALFREMTGLPFDNWSV